MGLGGSGSGAGDAVRHGAGRDPGWTILGRIGPGSSAGAVSTASAPVQARIGQAAVPCCTGAAPDRLGQVVQGRSIVVPPMPPAIIPAAVGVACQAPGSMAASANRKAARTEVNRRMRQTLRPPGPHLKPALARRP